MPFRKRVDWGLRPCPDFDRYNWTTAGNLQGLYDRSCHAPELKTPRKFMRGVLC